MSHTKGPWVIEFGSTEPDAVYGIYSADGTKIVETDTGVYPPNIEDARLIAAAPELLAAVKAVYEEVGQHGENSRWDFIMNILSVAISKAEGE